MSNSPEKNDPPTSAIVNTSTNLGNVNLNVVPMNAVRSPEESLRNQDAIKTNLMSVLIPG